MENVETNLEWLKILIEAKRRLTLSKGWFKSKLKSRQNTKSGLCDLLQNICKERNSNRQQTYIVVKSYDMTWYLYTLGQIKKPYKEYWFKKGRIPPRLKLIDLAIKELTNRSHVLIANNQYIAYDEWI